MIQLRPNASPNREPVQDLEANFEVREKPAGSTNRNSYQECLVCGKCFFGGTSAKKSHLSGVKLSGRKKWKLK